MKSVLSTLIGLGGLLLGLSIAVISAPPCPAYTLTPTGQFANIRTEPTTDSRIVGTLKQGANVCATELVNGWYTLAEGGGYVRSDVVKATGAGVVVTPTRVAPTATPIIKQVFCPKACEVTITIQELP